MAEGIRLHEVNIELGDKMSEYFYEGAKLTRANRPDMLDETADSFEGTVEIGLKYFSPDYAKINIGHELDGIGTKPEIRERLNDHYGAAFDLFAMIGDDVAPRGGELLTVDTVLDVNKLNDKDSRVLEGMHDLARGMVDAAKTAGAVVMTGEIAELGPRINGYGVFNYHWCGVGLYAVHRDRRLTGEELQPGQQLVGLTEPGFRSNGITDVRNAMTERYGPEWHHMIEPSLGSIALGELVQTPSTIYAGLMRELQGGFREYELPTADITGVAHITGGGQPSKIGRLLRRATTELGVTIDSPIEPPAVMLEVQRIQGFDDRKAYGKWHMGPGMIVATTEAEKVITKAAGHNIAAQVIGEVTDEPGIRIKNRGAVQDEEYLTFE